MARVFIGIGSNINPEENVRTAVHLLRQSVQLIAVSTFYLTNPIGPTDQPCFYNGMVEIETDLSPGELKHSVLLQIETQLGRVRTGNKYEPRTVDLDIVLYDNLPDSEDPQISTRPFLALPLYELNPDLVLPASLHSIKDIAVQLENSDMKPLPELTEQLRRELKNEQSQS